MADTDNVASETVASETLKNDATAPVETTQAAAPSKEDNQLIMRLAQEKKELEAKLAAKDAAEAAARQKQLEEKEEYKTLYEQSQSKLKEIEDATAEAVRKDELKKATESLYAEYPANVVELAKTAGLALSDDSEEAQAALKQKLDTFKSTIGTPTPSANNPRPVSPESATREELLQRMRGGDKAATLAYIRENPGIKRMKEIAQNGA